MRSFAILSAAGLAAAQITTIIITDGITTTLTLPAFTESTPLVTVTSIVPETIVTVTPEPTPSTTVVIVDGTTTVPAGFTTTTAVVVDDPPVTTTIPIVIPTYPESVTPVPLPSVSESASTFTGPASTVTGALPSANTTLATLTQTYFTSTPNATSSGPVVVPTAAADKLQGSVVGLVAAGIASFLLI
ncbi:uncharacterized protein GLRG_06820 [Colletotrichum graminicola M1.001]|uniref:Uncharacterized protein n=2 Tax=Colletotrichum graminicola TaxID=31870 RepID=E3QKZ3_COLGM|nr:uncharacterized protein GLRG_06820 [Colletotrichum graminicola M1.001]EFQ31531.1 hypothetical protein GLRG_06820 [Colletotrichum graminicola M1.001]